MSKSTRDKVHFTPHVIDIWTILLQYKIHNTKKYKTKNDKINKQSDNDNPGSCVSFQ